MGKLTRRIDNLGRIVIPKEIRNNLGIYEGCECSIIPTNDGILISKSERSLPKDLQFLIDKYLSEDGWSDTVLKLMEIQEEMSSKRELNK